MCDMGDLTELQSSMPVKIAGADSTGLETNFVNATTYGLKVDGSDVTQPVSGTFWPTTQPVSLTVLPSIATGSNVIGSISNTSFAATQSGSWTLAATQSGTWNITNISGTVSLPTGASTSALQTTGNTSLSSIDGKLNSLGQKTMVGSVPVVIASDQTITVSSGRSWTLASVTDSVSAVQSGTWALRLQDGVGNAITSASNNNPTPLRLLHTATPDAITANTAFGSNGAACALTFSGNTGVGFVLSNGGNFIGSIAAQMSMDGGVSWTNSLFYDPVANQQISTYVSGAGNYKILSFVITPGVNAVRAVVTAYTSGSSNVFLRATNAIPQQKTGQNTMAQSTPVVIASDQTALPVTISGTSTAVSSISSKLRYIGSNVSITIGTTYVTVYTYSGSGVFYGFQIISDDPNASFKLTIDSDVIFETTAAITSSFLEGTGNSTQSGQFFYVSADKKTIDFSSPSPIRYTSLVKLEVKFAANKHVTSNFVWLTQET